MFSAHYSAKVLTLAALICSAVQSGWCLDNRNTLTQYAHRIWGDEEGLFQPTIYSILQTRDGFLWLGTQDSLIRFDGARFREFEYHDKPVLHGSLIRTLMQDRSGNLWVGSVGNGLARISPSGEFIHFGKVEGLLGDSVTCLSEDKDGTIWVCTEQGLGRITGGKARMFTKADGLPRDEIRASCEVSGSRWIAGRTFSLGKWDGTSFADVLHEPVNALLCAHDGSVWAGTENGVVHIRSGETRRFTARDGLPDNAVSSLAEGPDSSIWVGTSDGISRFANEEFSAYRIGDGLSHSVVLSLAFDREGSLWAGTKNGLDQFSDSQVTPFTTNEGLSSNETSAVVADHQGRLWIGTLDRGLNVFDGHHFQSITRKTGLSDDRVLSLAVDKLGDVWAGTGNGVTRFRSDKVIGTYDLAAREVLALYVDVTGDLWAATSRGLEKFDGLRFRKIELPADTAGSIMALAGGKDMRLFLGGENSKFTYLRNGKFSTYSLPEGAKPVVSYEIDETNNTVWMGTLGSALIRWRDGKAVRIRVHDGLYDNRIYSILRDDQQNLWIASSKGIFRVGARELNDFADGKRSSITSVPFSTGQFRFECRSGVQPAACRTRDGRLWFSTTSGLVVVDPKHLQRNRVAPPVHFTAVIVDGERVNFDRGVEIRPGQRNLEIRYAGLSFISTEKVSFQYILDGFDHSWTNAGSRREAFFTNLPPGEFNFKVRARNADGVWSTEAALVHFTIEPRLYQRWWFFPALTLILAAGAAAIYRNRVRRLRQQFALVTAERTRIARELHDTLLQGLAGVTMQLHAVWMGLPPGSKEKRVLGEILQDASQYSAEARQSLWGLRSADPESQMFSERLTELARSSVAHSDIALVLDIQPLTIEDQPETEFQLLRIAKEAISNVLRHADASSLRVQLILTNGELHLSFTDDGRGFPSGDEYQKAGHFGLLGMKERAEEIGAVLEIESSPRGTSISTRLPLVRNAELAKTRQTG